MDADAHYKRNELINHLDNASSMRILEAILKAGATFLVRMDTYNTT